MNQYPQKLNISRPKIKKESVLKIWNEIFLNKNIPGKQYQQTLPGINIKTMQPDIVLLLKLSRTHKCKIGEMGTGMTTLFHLH